MPSLTVAQWPIEDVRLEATEDGLQIAVKMPAHPPWRHRTSGPGIHLVDVTMVLDVWGGDEIFRRSYHIRQDGVALGYIQPDHLAMQHLMALGNFRCMARAWPKFAMVNAWGEVDGRCRPGRVRRSPWYEVDLIGHRPLCRDEYGTLSGAA